MEVHHHSHGAHGKKTWKNYVWEFLMLFLAVFCGFLAEYQLEHKVEKDREKQYILSMIEDIDTDILNLDSTSKLTSSQIANIDTLLLYFPDNGGPYNRNFFSKITSIYGSADFIKADRTMQQLKNSGGMRLIRNKKSSDAITYYDMMNSNLKIIDYNVSEIFSALRFYRFEVMREFDIMKDMKEKTPDELEKAKTNYWLKSDPQSLGKLKNLIFAFKWRLSALKNAENKMKDKAIKTQAILKKEYRIK